MVGSSRHSTSKAATLDFELTLSVGAISHDDCGGVFILARSSCLREASRVSILINWKYMFYLSISSALSEMILRRRDELQ